MKILKIFPGNINQRYIADAVEALNDGHIIICPTDGIYALAVDALNKKAVERLCALKGLNPEKNTLSIACADLSQASEYVKIDNTAFSILKEYLPGPFTFVMQPSTRLPKIFKNRKTIGLRIPDNEITRCIAQSLGNPLLTTSVKIDSDDPDSGVEPENLAYTYHNNVAVTIDGGRGKHIGTTIVDITDPAEPQILRQGAGSFQL